MSEGQEMRQFLVTPAASKRLIARALAADPEIDWAAKSACLVIVAGTTNGYVAEEILAGLGQAEGFSRVGFRRGITAPPGVAPKTELAGDVVIRQGQWQRGKTIFDVADDLVAGDIVLKGANALNVASRRAAVYIGHPHAGTAGKIIPAVAGRRVRLIVPVGLEKRVDLDVEELARDLNRPGASGPRLLLLPGDVFTELDAVSQLTGAWVDLVAAGGCYGAEGAVWLAVSGQAEQVQAAEELIKSVADEEPCRA